MDQYKWGLQREPAGSWENESTLDVQSIGQLQEGAGVEIHRHAHTTGNYHRIGCRIETERLPCCRAFPTLNGIAVQRSKGLGPFLQLARAAT